MDWHLLVLFSLLAAAAPSDKVNFQLLELDSPITSLTFCGDKGQALLALTQKNSVYRSENQGLAWRKINDILEREGIGAVIGKQTTGQVEKIVVSPADSSLIALIGSEGITWYSEDCGKTLSALNHGRPIFEFKFHPKVREWALAAAWTQCSDFQNTPCKIYKSLFVTQNLGKNWTQISDYVVQFNWAQHNMLPYIQLHLPNTRVLVTRLKDNSGNQVLKGWSYNVDMLQSDDFFKTSTVLVPRGNKFILAERYILVAQVIEEGSDEVQMLVSNEQDLGKFYKPELPVKRIPEHSYTLIDTSEESIILNINHYGEGAEYGNVYISDSSGRRFALSLLHNLRSSNGVCDFIKIDGIEGIYVANVKEQDFEDESTGKNKKKKKNAGTVKSYITFDKGGMWNPITPPERDVNGVLLKCEEEDCSLHLHNLNSNQIAPAYSTKNAVGLILAVGNVGSKLSYRAEDLSTYLSRDGGLTWLEVRKGSYIYEIGDHGALIVMADKSITDSVIYSWNEGLTWEVLKVAEEPFEVTNIVIEPGATSQAFMVYGSRKGQGISVAVDFSTLHEPQCRLPERPEESGSDYEVWSPNDGRAGSRCLMGRYMRYTRRKREAECYNGEDYEKVTFVENCLCTPLDYECDIGYFLDESNKCQKIPNFEQEMLTCEDDVVYYEIPTGYRRVAGNTCEGGVRSQLEPLRVHCADSSMSSGGLMILCILAVVLILYVLSQKSDSLKSWLDRIRGSYISQGFTSNLDFVPDSPDEDMFNKPDKHD
jgi:hypothetical protein